MSQEQSYIGTENAVQTPAGKEFLQNYELRGWQLSPRIYKILGVSVLANLLFFGVAAQTSLLTMKGCESPFVGRVCQVLDTVYVGAVLFGTDREFVDAAYERIDLGEADITFVDVTGQTGPLEYPEGYFQVANPEQFAAMQAANQNSNFGFNPTTPVYTPPPAPPFGGGVLGKTPRLPKANPNAVKGDEPDLPFKIEDETADADVGRGGNKPPLGNANTNGQVANANTNNPTVTPTDPEKIQINRAPLRDLMVYVLDEQAKNGVDLKSEFSINGSGKFDKNGRLDPKTWRFRNASSSNETMVKIVEEAIQAVNMSGYLQYLSMLSGSNFSIELKQDQSNITASLTSEMESPTRAISLKTLIGQSLRYEIDKKLGQIAELEKSSNPEDLVGLQNRRDEVILMQQATVEADGKRVVLRFDVPKEVAHPMIERKLAEQANEAKKPNGNAGMRPADKTAAK